MAEDPDVVQVPVKRFDIALTLQDLMTPLTTLAERHAFTEALATAPETQLRAAELAALARQILEVASHLDAVAPHVLAPTPPPAAPDAAAPGQKDA